MTPSTPTPGSSTAGPSHSQPTSPTHTPLTHTRKRTRLPPYTSTPFSPPRNSDDKSETDLDPPPSSESDSDAGPSQRRPRLTGVPPCGRGRGRVKVVEEAVEEAVAGAVAEAKQSSPLLPHLKGAGAGAAPVAVVDVYLLLCLEVESSTLCMAL